MKIRLYPSSNGGLFISDVKFTRTEIELFEIKIKQANIDSKEKSKEHVKQIK